MKTYSCICLIVVLSVLVGCNDKNEVVARDIPRELSADFERQFAMMTNANTEARAFADQVMQKLLSVTDPQSRKQLFDRWRQVALKFDYHALPFADNDPRGTRSSTMMDDMFSQVFPKAAESEEEKWHIKLEYLGWLRAVAMAVATKRPYPQGVFATKDNRLGKVRGYNKALEEYKRWLRRYNGCSFKYEWELVGVESWFQQGKSKMSPETAKRIENEIEKFLGRKIRTKEQCDADFYGRRRVELPEYVPAPEGLEDKWTGKSWR